MISSSSILAMLLPALVLAVAALPLLYRGWRGRIINDHPFCRGCGFDLFGLTQPAVCPECGRALGGPAAIRVGERRRRKGFMTTGLVMLGLGVAWIALLVANDLGQLPLPSNKLKPTWWLIAVETRRPGPAVAAALDELALRTLTPGQEAELVQRALAIQADAKQSWLSQWGELVERADVKGTLSAQDLQRYLLASADPQLTIRSRLREGQKVTFQLTRDSRVSDTCLLAVEYTCMSLELEGQELINGRLSRGSLGSSGGFTGQSGRPLPISSTKEARTAAYRSIWKVEYRRSFGRGPALATRQYDFRGTCTILPVDQPSAEAVVDPTLDEQVRSCLALRLDPQVGAPPGWVGIHVQVRAPPLPLALEVFLEQPSQQMSLGRIYFHQGDNHSWDLSGCQVLPGQPLRLVLRPSLEAAEESVDIKRFYLGPDILYNCEQVPASGSVTLTLLPASATQPATRPADSEPATR